MTRGKYVKKLKRNPEALPLMNGGLKITPSFFVMLYSAELKSKDLQPLISKHLGTYRLFQFLTLSGFLLLLFFRPMR